MHKLEEALRPTIPSPTTITVTFPGILTLEPSNALGVARSRGGGGWCKNRRGFFMGVGRVRKGRDGQDVGCALEGGEG